MTVEPPYTLGIDVGTTATKALILGHSGKWEMASWPSSEWTWGHLKEWLSSRGCEVERVGITAHGPSALVIKDGEMVGRPIFWHEPMAVEFERPSEGDHVLPSSRAWVPSRIAQWEASFGEIGDGVAVQLKDRLNLELTGVLARDTRSMRGFSGVGHFHLPEDVIGKVHAAGEEMSGIRSGAEVICGCDDLTAGVLGLELGVGEGFNLANTSEHVGVVGIGEVDGLSWLPPLGRLPSLTYLSTGTGAKSLANRFGVNPSKEAALKFAFAIDSGDEDAMAALNELNEPVMALVDQLDITSLSMGGGLAEIPQLVSSRSGIRVCGQEVSVLGVARLAQRPLAVIFGAGKVGRGFLAQLLARAGWRIHFVDPVEDMVAQLSSGSYHIVNLATGEVEEMSGHTASVEDWRLEEENLILTSIGANSLPSWAESVAGLDRAVDVILAENHPAPAALVRESVVSQRVGIAQAQVLRSCIEPTEEQKNRLGQLTVQVQDHWSLPLDGDALIAPGLVRGVPGFTCKENFTVELTRKLYTYNAINAAVCYLGAEKGYEWLSDAANDPEIIAVAEAVGRESSEALVLEHGFVSDDQNEWCAKALAKYQDETILDPIERNCRDPIRKLGRYDRILGPIHLCLRHGIAHHNLLQTMRAALLYHDSRDENSVTLYNSVKSGGMAAGLTLVAPDCDDSLFEFLAK